MSVRDPELLRIVEAYRRRSEARNTRYSSHDRANSLRLQELQSRMMSLLPDEFQRSMNQRRFLEIGCGSGYWLRWFIARGALPNNVVGVDLLGNRLAKAQAACPEVPLYCQDASALGFQDSSFDLILQATVFSSMLNPGMRAAAAAEMARVLKRGGYVLWYDFFVGNPWNPDVRAIGRSEILSLFPGCRVRLQRLTLAPPLARILTKFSESVYQTCSAVRIFSTHYLGLIEKI